jgi:hypothetical protein
MPKRHAPIGMFAVLVGLVLAFLFSGGFAGVTLQPGAIALGIAIAAIGIGFDWLARHNTVAFRRLAIAFIALVVIGGFVLFGGSIGSFR